MKKIALTGGIGTGKTYISNFFVQMGIPVFDADAEAKRQYQNPEVVNTLCSHFGANIVIEGKLNLDMLGKVVFAQADSRDLVNSLIHPRVMEAFDIWAEHQDTSAVILESAIIFENELEKFFDMVIVVDAPLATRVERIKKRNPDLTEEQIMMRINAQMPQEEKVKRADLVITNA